MAQRTVHRMETMASSAPRRAATVPRMTAGRKKVPGKRSSGPPSLRVMPKRPCRPMTVEPPLPIRAPHCSLASRSFNVTAAEGRGERSDGEQGSTC